MNGMIIEYSTAFHISEPSETNIKCLCREPCSKSIKVSVVDAAIGKLFQCQCKLFDSEPVISGILCKQYSPKLEEYTSKW